MYGERIKELRTKKGITQANLASVLGVGPSTLRMWELENSQPNIPMLIGIADYFEVTTDYLLGRSSDRTEVKTPDDMLKLPPMIRGKYQELKDKLLYLVLHCNKYYDFIFTFFGKLFSDMEWVLQGTDDNAEEARKTAEDGLLRYDDHMTEFVQEDLAQLEGDTLSYIRKELVGMIYRNYNRKILTSEADLEREQRLEAEEEERRREAEATLADMQNHDMIDRGD